MEKGLGVGIYRVFKVETLERLLGLHHIALKRKHSPPTGWRLETPVQLGLHKHNRREIRVIVVRELLPNACFLIVLTKFKICTKVPKYICSQQL